MVYFVTSTGFTIESLYALVQFLSTEPANSPDFHEAYMYLRRVVSSNFVKFKFVKKDNTLRELYATNMPSYIKSVLGEHSPKDHADDDIENSKVIADMHNRLIKCFDIEKDAFRSVKFASVLDAYVFNSLEDAIAEINTF